MVVVLVGGQWFGFGFGYSSKVGTNILGQGWVVLLVYMRTGLYRTYIYMISLTEGNGCDTEANNRRLFSEGER
jgi:hypothetical protein